jgi:hypothetical protein
VSWCCGLRSSVPIQVVEGAAEAQFTLGADASAWFVLEVVMTDGPSPCARPDYVRDAFKETVNFWRNWIGRSTYKNRWREMVNRSALVLKLLTSREHGSIVAAPTFGLPEVIGGVRNWDYRYSWIRDSSFTLYGLMRLGYTSEAADYMRWMMARCEQLEPERLAPHHVRHRRPTGGERRDRWTTSRDTWDRVRSGSATPPTPTCSSTSTAS